MNFKRVLAPSIILSLSLSTTLAAGPKYVALKFDETPLSVLPLAISPAGVITGTYVDSYHKQRHCFISTGMNLNRLETSTIDVAAENETDTQGTRCTGIGLNNTLIGNYWDKNQISHGFIRSVQGSKVNVTIFDAPGATKKIQEYGTFPTAINNSGTVIGYLNTDNQDYVFIRTANGIFKKLGLQNGYGIRAFSINKDGVLTGYHHDLNTQKDRSFVYSAKNGYTIFNVKAKNGKDLFNTRAVSINDKGVVTGYYWGADFKNHGFIRAANGNITTFDPVKDSKETFPTAISANNTIIGNYRDKNSHMNGFIRNPNGSFVSFEFPIPDYNDIPTYLMAINSNGTIAGYYGSEYDIIRGFMRIPAK